jgi:hypothetical protein
VSEFVQRRLEQLDRELGVDPDGLELAFEHVERRQLETELFKVGCALAAAIDEYGTDGQLGLDVDGFRGAAGRTITFHVVGGRLYVSS